MKWEIEGIKSKYTIKKDIELWQKHSAVSAVILLIFAIFFDNDKSKEICYSNKFRMISCHKADGDRSKMHGKVNNDINQKPFNGLNHRYVNFNYELFFYLLQGFFYNDKSKEICYSNKCRIISCHNEEGDRSKMHGKVNSDINRSHSMSFIKDL